MNKLSQKQEYFYNLLFELTKNNNHLPTLNEIKKQTMAKSYNTIYQYLTKLEEKGYLIFSKDDKKITFLKDSTLIKDILLIPFIDEKKVLKIENYLNQEKKYVAFQIKNNYLKKSGIFYKDILIIDKDNSYLNNKFVLVNYCNSYGIYKYVKKDGFNHLINDKDLIILENTNCILGKVVSLIRKNI